MFPLYNEFNVPWYNAAPSQAEVKYLTWHRSVSSQLSLSRNPPGAITVMHTSTLDKLYAWEEKLYDEVKVISFFVATLCEIPKSFNFG